jgi:hypothetical protein
VLQFQPNHWKHLIIVRNCPQVSDFLELSKLWTGSLRGKKSLTLRWSHSACLVDNKIISKFLFRGNFVEISLVFGGFGQTHGQSHSRLNDIVVLDTNTLEVCNL